MPTEVKICGLSSEEAVETALEAGADLVGFVFFAASPRNVTPERAAALAKRARGRAGIVALTVDAGDAFLREMIAALQPDLLQLHGRETPARVADIRAAHGIAVMKVFGIANAADLDNIPASRSERILLDAKPPRDATRPGGLGAPFDWSLLQGVAIGRPWLLSGGLDAANVGEALSITGAPGVDVSSGVESAPGVKDPHRIREFVRAVRAFDRPLRHAI